MVCQWHVLIKEEMDNLLQYAKVLTTIFLKLAIHQFYPATILRYTVDVLAMFVNCDCLSKNPPCSHQN